MVKKVITYTTHVMYEGHMGPFHIFTMTFVYRWYFFGHARTVNMVRLVIFKV